MNSSFRPALTRRIICFGLLALASSAALAAPDKPLPYVGVNLSGGEFGGVKPGETSIYGQKYIYPSASEFDYYLSKGMNVFRLPFLWERLQPERGKPFDAVELERIKTVVKTATDKGGVIILDPHDYARYYGKIIGGPDVSEADFAAFWAALATAFKGSSRVWFGLMNEPHDMPNAQWRADANAAIAAIRKAGAKNLILVPGNSWTGAHSWVGSGNGAEMLKIVDPANHYFFEAHQYLDSDSSGSHAEAVSATIGSERLRAFTQWCRVNKKRAFLGEFGAAANPISAAAVGDMLAYMEANADVWTGFHLVVGGAMVGRLYVYAGTQRRQRQAADGLSKTALE